MCVLVILFYMYNIPKNMPIIRLYAFMARCSTVNTEIISN